MTRWRIVVHALDRTGPPMLARSFLRWTLLHRPDDSLDVVAFRGGELVDSFVELAPVRVLLDPSESWDPARPPDGRIAQIRRRIGSLPRVDASLLVSVAAAQALPLLDDDEPVVTWSVEQGDDLHWIDDAAGLVERTSRWLAGSTGTERELRARLPPGTPIGLRAEFIERPRPMTTEMVANCRTALGAGDDDLLVVGAGIGTSRKGVDLFLEVALAAERRGLDHLHFAWLGGERDDLHWRVRDETARLGVRAVRWFGSVTDVDPWLAAADVFLHTARLDSFPLVCAHAAAVSTPVVAFRGTGGTEDMLGPAFVGAPYPDVEGLVDALEHLGDPGARRSLGQRQHDIVSRSYMSDVAAPAILAELAAATRPQGVER